MAAQQSNMGEEEDLPGLAGDFSPQEMEMKASGSSLRDCQTLFNS
jgi:hypothetical protein